MPRRAACSTMSAHQPLAHAEPVRHGSLMPAHSGTLNQWSDHGDAAGAFREQETLPRQGCDPQTKRRSREQLQSNFGHNLHSGEITQSTDEVLGIPAGSRMWETPRSRTLQQTILARQNVSPSRQRGPTPLSRQSYAGLQEEGPGQAEQSLMHSKMLRAGQNAGLARADASLVLGHALSGTSGGGLDNRESDTPKQDMDQATVAALFLQTAQARQEGDQHGESGGSSDESRHDMQECFPAEGPEKKEGGLLWNCTRKYTGYSLYRKGKLRFSVNQMGVMQLSRGLPMLNSGNTRGVVSDMLDTHATPSARGTRDSQGWIASAMQSLTSRRHITNSMALDGSVVQLPVDSSAGDTVALEKQAVLQANGNGDKTNDSALRLGGQYARHVLDIESIVFKEKYKSDAMSTSSHEEGHPKTTQQKVGKGTLLIHLKDRTCVRLSGMNVADVASDLERRMLVWERRRKSQSAALDRLVLLAKTKVSWDNAHHRDLLSQFWEAVYPSVSMPEPSLNVNVSPGWKDMGFQSNDPCTDFRAMGLLGLHCLWYHATKYPLRVRTIIHAGKPARDFPYGAVGINLVAALVQMLKLGQTNPKGDVKTDVEATPLFAFFCKMPHKENAGHSSEIEQASELEDIMIMSKEHPFAFEETFCTAYEMLDDMWVEDPPTNILFFNTLLTRCTGLLKRLIDKRCIFSLRDLNLAIRDYIPASESTERFSSSAETSSKRAVKPVSAKVLDKPLPDELLVDISSPCRVKTPACHDEDQRHNSICASQGPAIAEFYFVDANSAARSQIYPSRCAVPNPGAAGQGFLPEGLTRPLALPAPLLLEKSKRSTAAVNGQRQRGGTFDMEEMRSAKLEWDVFGYPTARTGTPVAAEEAQDAEVTNKEHHTNPMAAGPSSRDHPVAAQGLFRLTGHEGVRQLVLTGGRGPVTNGERPGGVDDSRSGEAEDEEGWGGLGARAQFLQPLSQKGRLQFI